MTGTALFVLMLLLTKHFLFDFLLQTPYQSRNKADYAHPGGILHAALHVLATGLILAFFRPEPPLFFLLLAIELLVHYHMDWARAWTVRRFRLTEGFAFWALFGFDQFVHHATYAFIVFAMFAI